MLVAPRPMILTRSSNGLCGPKTCRLCPSSCPHAAKARSWAPGWRGGPTTVVTLRLVVAAPGACQGQGVGGTLLAHLEAAVREAGWECPVLHAHGPAGFYQARSGWAVPGAATRTPRRRTRASFLSR